MATSFKLTGVLHAVFPEQIVSDKFRKQEFVLKVDADKYPQFIKFQCVNERIDLLDAYDQNDTVTVHFDIQGKEYIKGTETLYFTSLNAWKLEGSAPKSQSGKPMTKVADLNPNDEPYDDQDTPF